MTLKEKIEKFYNNAEMLIKLAPMLSAIYIVFFGMLGFLSLNRYYADFGVELYLVAGLSDYLKAPLSLRTSVGFYLGIFCVLLNLIMLPGIVERYNNESIYKKWTVYAPLVILGLTLPLLIYMVYDEVGRDVEDLKSGYYKRYNVHTSFANFQCSVYVGKTATTSVFWLVDKQRTVLIPNSEIKMLELVFDNPPLYYPKQTLLTGHYRGVPIPREPTEQEKELWFQKVNSACN